jgi:transposase
VWRTDDAIPPTARFIGSPYDVEARYSRTRAPSWLGYTLHLTATCDPSRPHLITDVRTTTAPVVDEESLPTIQRARADRDLLPAVQVAASGDTAAGLLVASRREHDIALIGAARPDGTWQAQAGMGFAAADFRIDGAAQPAICPMGHTSASWTLVDDGRQRGLVKVKSRRLLVSPARAGRSALGPTTAGGR